MFKNYSRGGGKRWKGGRMKGDGRGGGENNYWLGCIWILTCKLSMCIEKTWSFCSKLWIEPEIRTFVLSISESIDLSFTQNFGIKHWSQFYAESLDQALISVLRRISGLSIDLSFTQNLGIKNWSQFYADLRINSNVDIPRCHTLQGQL